jgi:hypothetical protein
MISKRGRPKKIVSVQVETKESIIVPKPMSLVDIVDTKDSLMYVKDLIATVNEYNRSLVNGGKLIIDAPIFPNPACFNYPNVKQIFNQHTMSCFAVTSGTHDTIGEALGCLPFSRIIVNILNGYIHAELTK